MMGALEELKKVLGASLLIGNIEKIPYSRDASYFPGNIPMAVAIPKDVSQIQKILRICYEYEIPVTGRGGGTSLTGASVPSVESIVISLSRLNRILEINPQDRYVVAEAGVRLDDLSAELSKTGLMYPPDPGSAIAATVGGSISTNAGGLRGAMYGATKEWVLGLEVVLPNGEVTQTGGKVLKRSTGYDLTALMVGSEGTLGLITKAILKLVPKPESVGRIMAYYSSIENVSSAIGRLKSQGMTPLMAEFMDKIALDSLAHTKGVSFPGDARYLLMVDVASSKESLSRIVDEAKDVISETGANEITSTTDEKVMSEIYGWRKGLYAAELGERGSPDEYIIIGDIIVPPSKLPAAMREIDDERKREKVRVSLFGHIGDGNIHVNVFYNSKNQESLKGAHTFLLNIGRIAIRNGGSTSAEHGIGLEKKELLVEEMKFRNSMKNIELMREIKKIFDPRNIMNRGKMF